MSRRRRRLKVIRLCPELGPASHGGEPEDVRGHDPLHRPDEDGGDQADRHQREGRLQTGRGSDGAAGAGDRRAEEEGVGPEAAVQHRGPHPLPAGERLLDGTCACVCVCVPGCKGGGLMRHRPVEL